jgi:transposase InsO family protein
MNSGQEQLKRIEEKLVKLLAQHQHALRENLKLRKEQEKFATDKQIHFKDVATAQKEVKKYVDYYNEKRPHRSIEMLTPSAAHHQKGVLERCWKTYYSKPQIAINL